VDALVGTDLTDHVGEGPVRAVLGGRDGPERGAVPLRVLGDELGVLAFGVVLASCSCRAR
jgi:hypothetical protein